MSQTEVKAIAKGIRISPRKVGVVVALVRRRTVPDALTILENTQRKAAQPVAKLITHYRCPINSSYRSRN